MGGAAIVGHAAGAGQPRRRAGAVWNSHRDGGHLGARRLPTMTTDPDRFTESDRQRVNDAVAAAETWTEAAILPVVVARSSSYERAEGVVGALTALVVACIAFFVASPSGAIALVVMAASLGAGMALARCRDDVRLVFTSRARVRAEVAAGADAALADRRLRHADRDNGLLLYVSLLEKRAVVSADARVRAAMDVGLLRRLEAELTEATERGDAAAGLVRTIDSLAEPLARELPRPATLIDERCNELMLKV